MIFAVLLDYFGVSAFAGMAVGFSSGKRHIGGK
jgi:hypothetical protein